MTDYSYKAEVEGIDIEKITLQGTGDFREATLEVKDGLAIISFNTEDPQFNHARVSDLQGIAQRHLDRLSHKHRIKSSGLRFWGYSEPKRDGQGRTLHIQQTFINNILDSPPEFTETERATLKAFLEEPDSSKDFYRSQFNFGLQQDSAIACFMVMYNIVLSLCNDRQRQVDDFIITKQPSVAVGPSPAFPGRNETQYTKLRNQVGHLRPGTSLGDTERELEGVMNNFIIQVSKAIDELA